MPKFLSRETESRSHDINKGPHIKLQKKDHIQVRTPLWISGTSGELMGWQQVGDLAITSKHRRTTQQLYNHDRDGPYYNVFSGIAIEVLVTFYTAQQDPI